MSFFNFLQGKIPPLGGWVEKSPESPDVQAAADSAEKMFNTNSRGKKMFRLVSINSAKVQVWTECSNEHEHTHSLSNTSHLTTGSSGFLFR